MRIRCSWMGNGNVTVFLCSLHFLLLKRLGFIYQEKYRLNISCRFTTCKMWTKIPGPVTGIILFYPCSTHLG